ncbi:release factor glutamine methyltransferase [Caloranaerobacter azorensis DSM 13643]|uniref:Release factor glutamine methyltransferase n=1 Tax=Caloranaerobacter azorensis DSM 13643 TaxID=1121264 RepID=A0A1M5SJP8_9FIRM|nr:peptide chain release factor N(5)-glutamine methyltransferase [Caloranaerobacter azorensis]SHH38620.1 release factor glutamine methyltransferase [Caloranaerobacter azorensis DSM 13643]
MVRDYTIKSLLQEGMNILNEGDFKTPLLDAQLILCYTLSVDKLYIYTHPNDKVNVETVDKFFEFINRRREGYPVQYIIQKQEFMGLEFNVAEGVLIPRPDTEILVEKVIEIVDNSLLKGKKRINIVDIGTGSGAITLSLAYYLKNAFVYSIDISKKALDVAKENSKKFGLEDRVLFLEGSLFKPLSTLNLDNNIDVVVSNPPYIPTDEIEKLQIEVSKYEPRTALDGGEDGLDYYREIVKDLSKYLTDNGVIAFEIGYNQGQDVKELLVNSGLFKKIEIIKDLSGHDRVVVGENLCL